ncbi:MAG: A/G-specific adenine glycosylase [Clostridia bacterium]|nr:A/G-specific adenine glycosylase [Clostridia bacterium]
MNVDIDTAQLQRLSVPLMKWYKSNARVLPWRKQITPYRVWISEIMLQQTRVEAVKEYYARFMKRLPDIGSLSEIEEEELLKLWEGLGYYNRARNLKRAAQLIMADYGGEMPGSYEELLRLPGIGTYTAGAIGSIAFSLREPAVDGNVLRVLARLRGDYDDIMKPAVRKRVENELRALLLEISNEKENVPGILNQALMELGALVCVPNGDPRCDQCPLKEQCYAANHQCYTELPVKTQKKPRVIEDMTVILIMDDQEALLYKRGKKGLLAGLYEFPNAKGSLSEQEVIEYVEALGFMALHVERKEDAKHIFTHREWRMRVYAVKIAQLSQSELNQSDEEARIGTFADKSTIIQQYALPTAFAQFKKYLS